ncbi:MAG: LysM peptidoglycan-binding domain-containing protein [Lachnospiraceae bacterium]|nr:LysM peptidoglycan-binding domain-containing protein [Lachnospiraceae bacterium]
MKKREESIGKARSIISIMLTVTLILGLMPMQGEVLKVRAESIQINIDDGDFVSAVEAALAAIGDKVYDGTNTISGSLPASFSDIDLAEKGDVENGKDVKLNITGVRFEDAAADEDNNKKIVITAWNVSGDDTGSDVGQYSIGEPSPHAYNSNAKITPKIINASDIKAPTGTALNVTYNGTMNYDVVGGFEDGVIIGGNTVVLDLKVQLKGIYAHAGSRDFMVVSGSLSGADAGNYKLNDDIDWVQAIVPSEDLNIAKFNHGTDFDLVAVVNIVDIDTDEKEYNLTVRLPELPDPKRWGPVISYTVTSITGDDILEVNKPAVGQVVDPTKMPLQIKASQTLDESATIFVTFVSQNISDVIMKIDVFVVDGSKHTRVHPGLGVGLSPFSDGNFYTHGAMPTVTANVVCGVNCGRANKDECFVRFVATDENDNDITIFVFGTGNEEKMSPAMIVIPQDTHAVAEIFITAVYDHVAPPPPPKTNGGGVVAPPAPPVDESRFGTSAEALKRWEGVTSDISKKLATGGAFSHSIRTGRDTVVPTTTIAALAGTEGTLMMNTGAGVTFSISGMNIPAGYDGTRLNLGLRSGRVNAPDAALAAVLARSYTSIQIPMVSREQFGFTVNMHFNVGAAHSGKSANLYRFNSTTGAFEYLGSFPINEKGQFMFGISGGADYVVTVTDVAPDLAIVTTAANGQFHTVRPGDSMGRIARLYNTDLATLRTLNPDIRNVNFIRVGQQVRVQ